MSTHMPPGADASRPGRGLERLASDYVSGRLAGRLDRSGRPRTEPAPAWRRAAVIDDPHGAWAKTLKEQGLSAVRTWNQELGGADASTPDLPSALAGADLVIVRVPKDKRLFRAYLDAVRTVAPAALLLAAGAVKHMNPGFTEEMRRLFARVDVSPAAHKARLLIAGPEGTPPRDAVAGAPAEEVAANAASPAPEPEAGVPSSAPIRVDGSGHRPSESTRDAEIRPAAGWGHPVDIAADARSGLRVHALHGVFGAARVDPGSRLLAEALDRSGLGIGSVVELGCGNGWLAAWLMTRLSPEHLWACDISRLAVESTRRTLTANGLGVDGTALASPGPRGESCGRAGTAPDPGTSRIAVHLDDVLDTMPAAIEAGWPAPELIVCNPPFHRGAAIDTSIAQRMIRAAGRMLVPGGRAVFVYNSHLRYRPLLQQEIGATEQLARDRSFTVVAAQRG